MGQKLQKRIVLYNSMLNVGLPLHWLNLRSALKLIIFLRCNIKRSNNMRKHGITTLELSLDHPLGSSNKIKIWNAGFHGWRKNYVQGQDPTTNSIFVWCQVWESSLYHSRGEGEVTPLPTVSFCMIPNNRYLPHFDYSKTVKCQVWAMRSILAGWLSVYCLHNISQENN